MFKIVAIDGPAGSGKGTVSAIIADKCNLLNIDTGATYRCVALAILKNNLKITDKDRIIKLLDKINIELNNNGKVFLNGEDVTDLIRSKEVTEIVSPISSIPEVRTKMVALQRKMADNSDVILEGRDITTVVFPNATYKFYLDASLEKRVDRRVKQNKEKGIDMSYQEIYDNIASRDYNDMHKEIGALKRTDNQIYIDTTDMTIDEVVNEILQVIRGD